MQTQDRWPDELPSILWAYRTTRRVLTEETPFALIYDVEAVVPVEVFEESPRIQMYHELTNTDDLLSEKDLLEESREAAAVRNSHYKQKRMVQYFFQRIKERSFVVEDLVLRKVEAAGKHVKKLAPPLEAPYQVRQVVCPGTYRLTDLNGSSVPRCWNSTYLKKYYQ